MPDKDGASPASTLPPALAPGVPPVYPREGGLSPSLGNGAGGDSHPGGNAYNMEGQLEEVKTHPPGKMQAKPYKTGDHFVTFNGVTFWLISDCCGLTCAVFTYLLLLYGLFVVNGVMLAPFSQNTFYDVFNFFFFNFLVFMAYSSHIRAMCTEPGVLQVGNATKENIDALQLKPGQVAYKCTKCNSLKPPRAHHCSVCRRCVRKMDHHCPWINNCVGENNQKFFVLFTFYIAALSLHGGCLCFYTFYRCVIVDWNERANRYAQSCPSSFSPPVTTVILAMCAVEAILFFLFTAVMFCTQTSNIIEDSTGIEQLKQEDVTWQKRSALNSMRQVFGDPITYRWLSPFHGSTICHKPPLGSYKYSPLYNV